MESQSPRKTTKSKANEESIKARHKAAEVKPIDPLSPDREIVDLAEPDIPPSRDIPMGKKDPEEKECLPEKRTDSSASTSKQSEQGKKPPKVSSKDDTNLPRKSVQFKESSEATDQRRSGDERSEKESLYPDDSEDDEEDDEDEEDEEEEKGRIEEERIIEKEEDAKRLVKIRGLYQSLPFLTELCDPKHYEGLSTKAWLEDLSNSINIHEISVIPRAGVTHAAKVAEVIAGLNGYNIDGFSRDVALDKDMRDLLQIWTYKNRELLAGIPVEAKIIGLGVGIAAKRYSENLATNPPKPVEPQAPKAQVEQPIPVKVQGPSFKE